MSEELKPCPFCGSNNISIEQVQTIAFCECLDCGGISRDYRLQEGYNPEQRFAGAINYWNTRPIEGVLRAENERLKMVLREFSTWSESRLDDITSIGLQNIIIGIGDTAKQALKGDK